MERTRVEVGECRCFGAPHPVDWVELHPEVTMAMGTAVMAAVRASGDNQAILEGMMSECYVAFGIRKWSFTDEDGNPIYITTARPGWMDLVNRLLPWNNGGSELVDAADGLYSEDILRPLRSLTSKLSPAGPMEGSTSATQLPSPPPPTLPEPSLPMPSEDGSPSAVLVS